MDAHGFAIREIKAKLLKKGDEILITSMGGGGFTYVTKVRKNDDGTISWEGTYESVGIKDTLDPDFTVQIKS